MSCGTLKSLYLKNFLTYSECTFIFNSGLNIVYGPNGTGKSSIIAAILLIFGGNIKNLSRSKDIYDYIKYGENIAEILITFFYNHDEINLKRIISKTNHKTLWYINDIPKLEKDIKNLRIKLNIDLDNLCNFMPQDRVTDFLKMDPQQLLIAFQDNIDDGNFCTLRKNLMGFHENRLEKNNLLKKITVDHDSLEKRAKIVGEEVKKYEKWKENQDKIKLYEMKIYWIKYDNIRIEFSELKTKYDEAKKAHEQLSASLFPQKKEHDKIVKSIQSLGDAFIRKKSSFNSNIRELEAKRNEIEKYQREIKQSDINRDEIKKAIQETHKKIDFSKINVESLKSESDRLESEFNEKTSRLKSIDNDMNKATNDLEEFDKESSRMSIVIEKHQSSIKGLKHTLDNNAEKKNRILESVRYQDQDAYRAMEWIKTNKDVFKKEIYGPLLYHITLKNQEDARYLENHFSNRDLFAFVTDCSDDIHTFISNVREKIGLRVSCLLTDPNQTNLPTPDAKLFKKYSFRCFLKDLFEAPPILMSFLYDSYAVHRIPIFEKLSSKEIDEIMKIPGIQCFFVGNEKYTIKISSYTNLPTVRSFQLHNLNFIVDGLSDSKIREIETEIQKNQTEIFKLEKDLDSHKYKISKHHSVLEELRNERKNILGIKNRYKALQNQILSKTYEIESFQNAIKSYENQLLENDQKNSKHFQNMSKGLADMVQMIFNFKESVSKLLKEHLTLYYNVSYLKNIELKMEGVNSLLQCQLEQIDTLKNQVMQKRHDLDIIHREAKEASGIKNKEKIPDALSQALSEIPSDISDIQTKMTELQIINSSSYCFDPNIVSKSKDLQDKLSKSGDSIEKIKKDLNKIEKEEAEMKKQWLDRLNNSINIVSKTFTDFFSLIKSKGQLELIKDPDDNYEKYALGIMVSYRQDERMNQLSNLRHSGGEKAVAIMLLLMSMQQLSQSPFKMIDEINQGMDSVNEKTIVEVMMRTISKCKATKQYFFLSPKVLPDVEYDDSVTIHIIFNGIIIDT